MSVDAAEPRTYSFAFTLSVLHRSRAGTPTRGLADPGDLLGAANLAWAECVQRWDPGRARLSTYAWQRIHGRVRDCLRSERRHRRLQAKLQTAAAEPSAAPAWTAPLALRQAIAATRSAMSPTEQLVLTRVYAEGATLTQAAAERGTSLSTLERAHQRLLGRLRAAVEGEAAPPRPAPALRRAARAASAASRAAAARGACDDPGDGDDLPW